MSKFEVIHTSYHELKGKTDNELDNDLVTELIEGLADQFEQCSCLNEEITFKFFSEPKKGEFNDVEPSDSVSSIESCSTTASKKNFCLIKRKRKHAELQVRRDLEIAKAKARAQAAEAKADAADAVAEAKVRFMIEQANIEAEVELEAMSESGFMCSTQTRRSRRSSSFKSKIVLSGKKLLPESVINMGLPGTPVASLMLMGHTSMAGRGEFFELKRQVKLNPNVTPFLPSTMNTEKKFVPLNVMSENASQSDQDPLDVENLKL